VLFANIHAQDYSLYQKKWIVQDEDSLPYRLLLPENYDASKKYPVIFVLHGSGERGNDNELPLVHGADLFLKKEARKQYPAIVIFPQCPINSFWSNVIMGFDSTGKRDFYFLTGGTATRSMELLQELVNYILDTYPVNRNKVYVGGLSMGGMGTFELVRRMPGIFAAAFSICGGANPATAVKIKNTKWWIFHGAKDDVVPYILSEKMVIALRKTNATVKFNLYPEANHNSWDSAFAEPGLLPWLFSQHR